MHAGVFMHATEQMCCLLCFSERYQHVQSSHSSISDFSCWPSGSRWSHLPQFFSRSRLLEGLFGCHCQCHYHTGLLFFSLVHFIACGWQSTNASVQSVNGRARDKRSGWSWMLWKCLAGFILFHVGCVGCHCRSIAVHVTLKISFTRCLVWSSTFQLSLLQSSR